jgi:hypothetical protein
MVQPMGQMMAQQLARQMEPQMVKSMARNLGPQKETDGVAEGTTVIRGDTDGTSESTGRKFHRVEQKENK